MMKLHPMRTAPKYRPFLYFYSDGSGAEIVHYRLFARGYSKVEKCWGAFYSVAYPFELYAMETEKDGWWMSLPGRIERLAEKVILAGDLRQATQRGSSPLQPETPEPAPSAPKTQQ